MNIRNGNHILCQCFDCKRSTTAQSAAPGQAGPGGDMQGVIRGDGIVLIQNHAAADSALAVLKHDALGLADGRRCALVPAVADGSALVTFPIDICGTGSVHNAAGNGDAAGAAGDRTTAHIFDVVLIPTAAANPCGIVAPNGGNSTAADGDVGAIATSFATVTTANPCTHITACSLHCAAAYGNRTPGAANIAASAANPCAAVTTIIFGGYCRHFTSIDGYIATGTAGVTCTTTNPCGDTLRITYTAANSVDYTAMNGDGAAVR